MTLFFSLLLSVACLLAGFAWGRHCGYDAGWQAGQAVTPLVLRQESISHGICYICGHRCSTMEELIK